MEKVYAEWSSCRRRKRGKDIFARTTISAQIRSPVPFPPCTYPPTFPSLIDGPRGLQSPPMAVLQPGPNRSEGLISGTSVVPSAMEPKWTGRDVYLRLSGFWTLERIHTEIDLGRIHIWDRKTESESQRGCWYAKTGWRLETKDGIKEPQE
jgi:hypothetical protein